MWGFLTAVVICAFLIWLVCWLCRHGGEFEIELSSPSDMDCEGSNHGPTSLGGVMHQTCLQKLDGRLEMWCHTHDQQWDRCIAEFTNGA